MPIPEVNNININPSGVGTGKTGSYQTNTSWTYATSSVTEDCSTCSHAFICKYRANYSDIKKKLSKIENIPDVFTLNIKCEHYISESKTTFPGFEPHFPANPCNPSYPIYEKPYEVTCCCDKEE